MAEVVTCMCMRSLQIDYFPTIKIFHQSEEKEYYLGMRGSGELNSDPAGPFPSRLFLLPTLDTQYASLQIGKALPAGAGSILAVHFV